MKIDVQLIGLQQIQSEISRIRRDFPIKADTEIKKAGIEMRNLAIKRVPVDKGILKSQIRMYPGKNETAVTAETLYAPFVEWGTGELVDVPSDLKDYAITFKGKTGRIINREPKPFFFNSFLESATELIKRMKSIKL